MDDAPCILIVDDEPDSLELLQHILDDAGYAVLAACGAGDALAIAGRRRVDALVVDMVMPGMGGIELLRALRARGVGAGFVMVTAYGDMESYLEVMNLGAVEYLSKPVNPDHLLQTVARAAGPPRAGSAQQR